MNDDLSSQSLEQMNSLNYISENIYKNQPKNNVYKSATEEKEEKKIAYKNYLQEVSKIN